MRSPLPLQRPAFFFVRAVLGTICTICEAKLYDTVRLKINNRVARYMLFMLVASAGMWNASTGESLPYAACFELTISVQPFSHRLLRCIPRCLRYRTRLYHPATKTAGERLQLSYTSPLELSLAGPSLLL